VSEKRSPSPLVHKQTIEKVAQVCPTVGVVYAGMGPDARILTMKARKAAQSYKRTYGQYPGTLTMVKELASMMQASTQSGGVRPFGVSLLVVGVEPASQAVQLYQVDPSGAYWPWRASAIGRSMTNAKSFLEKRYVDDLELEDAVHLALLALKESFEGSLSSKTVEVGLVSSSTGSFKKLTPAEIDDYLQNL
jgi:20S proteasome subunit alpha 2